MEIIVSFIEAMGKVEETSAVSAIEDLHPRSVSVPQEYHHNTE